MQILLKGVIHRKRKEDCMRRIIILTLSCIVTINLMGCTSTKIEKEPVVIGELEDPLSEITDQKNVTDETMTNIELSATDESEQELTDDTSGTILDTKEGQVSDLTESDNDAKLTDTTSSILEPSKGIVMLEGMEEEVRYKTYQSELGYQMAYDIDRFTVTNDKGIDTFMTENSNPELYPYVFINIECKEYSADQQDIRGVDLSFYDTETGKYLNANSTKDTVKIGTYDAIDFKLIDGSEWNSLVKHYYLITTEQNYYVIQTNYYLEAAEGYGARILAMLDTFEINN